MYDLLIALILVFVALTLGFFAFICLLTLIVFIK